MSQKKILIIKLGALGDFVIAIGNMMEIKRMHPDAEFTLMTNSAFLSMAKQMGMFSDYIIDNRVSYFNLRAQWKLLSSVTNARFDRIYDLQCVSRTDKKYFRMIKLFSKAPYEWVNLSKQELRRVASKFGSVTKEKFEFTPKTTDLRFLHGENKHFHELPQKFVLLIPGCSPNHPYKRWPIAYYSQLAQRLAERGISSVVIGTKAEEAEVSAICASSDKAVSMLNKTSLLDIPDLCVRALAIVGNDTGPSHMAAFSCQPTIGIYDKRTACGALRGPKSVNLVSPDTIEKITVDMVWEKLLEFGI